MLGGASLYGKRCVRLIGVSADACAAALTSGRKIRPSCGITSIALSLTRQTSLWREADAATSRADVAMPTQR